jgi:hypothetical protein
VNNSLTHMLELCGSCLAPISPFATQEPNTLNYTLQWASMSTVESVDLRYRVVGSGTWIELNDIEATSYLLSGLEACSTYEFQAKSHCAGDQSEWSDVVSILIMS